VNFEKLGDAFTGPILGNIDALKASLDAYPFLWDMETGRQAYAGSAHTISRSILLRWGHERNQVAAMRELICHWRPEYLHLHKSLSGLIAWIDTVTQSQGLGRVMLTRLPPGGRISEHQDEGPYADLYERVHLCIDASLGENYFYVGKDHFIPAPGELWWLNHKQPHSVHNNGIIPRIHLIVDVLSETLREKRGVYYQRETHQDVIDEIHPLLVRHWKEIAKYPDIPLKPDWIKYQRLEDSGNLRIYTVRDCGGLVGYALFLVDRGLHYDVRMATQDILFLLPEYRKGRIGVNLIRYAEQRLKSEGVDLVLHHVKTTNQVGRLLEVMGYEEVDRIYMKRLKET
jgi:GNAT superfamily N-acetyltransferase